MLKRNGFTLIEVIVAVLIVSVVIAALLQMQGNATHKFFTIKKMMQTDQYSTFLLSNAQKYGFDSSRLDMKRLVDDFELESDLRRRLKSMPLEIKYEMLTTIDTSELEQNTNTSNVNTALIFEIGKTILKSQELKIQLIRVKKQ